MNCNIQNYSRNNYIVKSKLFVEEKCNVNSKATACALKNKLDFKLC